MTSIKKLLVAVVCGFYLTNASASVVMTGTRVIVKEPIKEKVIQLKNKSNIPYIVQLQIEQENGNTSGIPFSITPQIFKMSAGAGQSVKISMIEENLPKDRESVFYFVFSQLPIVNDSGNNGNKLLLAVTNRVKIFYRPKGLAENVKEASQNLKLVEDAEGLKMQNSSPYYISMREVYVGGPGKKIPLLNSKMLAPYSSVRIDNFNSMKNLSGKEITAVTVNDYGVDVVYKSKI